jgi:hypothetical protein
MQFSVSLLEITDAQSSRLRVSDVRTLVALRWESIVGHKRALRLKLNGQIGIALNIALQWMLEDFIMWWFPDLPKCITAPAVSLTFVGQTTSGSVRQADKLLVYLHFNRSRTVLLRAVT